jgi:predicted O-methyltransferase YrrM
LTLVAPGAAPVAFRSDRLFAANRAFLGEAASLAADLGAAEGIAGLINPREGLLLYTLARRASHLGDIAEIGAYKGRSTWYLARGLRDAGSPYKVISIDPHAEPGQLEAFRETLRRHELADVVDVRVSLSHDAARAPVERPLGLLWIDGDHRYEAVRQDFDDWFPRLAIDGWLAIHDTVNNWHGPTKLARDLLTRRADLADVGVVFLTLFARKTAPALVNRARALKARVAFEALTLLQARHAGLGPQTP